MELLERLIDYREPLTDPLREEALAHRQALLEPLIDLLRGEHRPRLLRALELLVFLDAYEAEPTLLDLFSHPSQKVRRPAIQAVARLFQGRTPSPDTLLLLEAQFCEEEVRSVENAIMDALAGFPERAGLPMLLRICGSGGDVATRRLLLRLRRLLDDEPREVWQQALEQVTEYGRQSLVRCVDFEPLKSLLAPAAPRSVAAPELEGFGRLWTPPEDRHVFPEELLAAAVDRLTFQGDRPGPRNLLVIGPSGVGKTAFLDEVFRRLLPQGPIILRTNTSTLMAGTKYIGEWQTRVQNLITRCSRPRNIIVFMEDANHLPFTGVYEGSTANFASIMKPFMEDGTITVVGETTPEALTRGLGTRPEVRRQFCEIKLDPPEGADLNQQIESMLEFLSYESGRELCMSASVRDYLISLADSFITGLAFPGKAFPVLRGVVSLLPEGTGAAEITPDLLVESVAKSTGLPVWLLEDKSPLDPARARDFFRRQVIGQEEPVEAIVDLITLIKAGLTDPTRPLGVFLFIGPTGVGKTELAKSLAEFVFGSRDRMVRVDMSEFKDYDSYRRLIGSEYGSGNEGLLTGKVKQHPFSVVLLDEFEKAHPNVYDLMLGLFDDGRLTSGRGDTVNFCNTIVIMTSNLGQAAQHDSSLGILARTTQVSDRDTIRAVEGYFSPEFINRIRVIMFRPLDLSAMQAIARREMTQALRRSGLARRDLIVDCDDAVLGLLLARGFTPRYGARPLKKAVEELFLLPIARELVKGPPPSGVLRVKTGDDGVKARFLVETARDFQEVRLPGGASVAELEKRWSACSAQVLEQELEGEYRHLAELAGEPGFWERDDSRRLSSRLHRLELLLQSWRSLGESLESFGAWLATSAQRKESGNQRHVQAARRYGELQSALDLMELKLRCRDELSQRDAYIRLRPLGPQIAGKDGLRILLEMYRGWARRIESDLIILNDPAPEDDLPDLLLRVSGPQSYGLLRQESGLHRFSITRKDGNRRQSALVRVDVIPAALREPAWKDGEVHGEGGLLRLPTGRYGERPRSRYGALHVETSTLAEGRNALDLAANERAIKDYLAALVADREPAQEPRVVRSYYFEPDNEVLDGESGLRARRLETVLEGALEAFLLAAP